MNDFPDNATGDVFRRLVAHDFDFTTEHIVDFHAVFPTEEGADKIALQYLDDHKSGNKFENIETKPHEVGGMELTLSKKMLVSYQAITGFENMLAERVSHIEGYLDGWGVRQD